MAKGVIVLVVVIFFVAGLSFSAESPAYPAGIKNTNNKNVPLTPEEALQKITVPEGFAVTLFAGEPNVAQPISMSFDDRGRIWVAECYSFEHAGGPWRAANQQAWDRILIFEDNGDGRFKSRKVFMESIQNLTSILPGFGGIFACSTPNLVFIPQKADDTPAGPPEILLTGWNKGGIGHCVFNGLTWGPDGWIYGMQGIQGESQVGKPGSDERVKFNGGVWRYHPTKKIFEVVAEGTVNPWGLDFDEHGQGFFTNCVLGHLWHLIPGAHYQRMYGNDYTPNTYGQLKCCSDHVHYGGGPWEKSGTGKANEQAGGGHAHSGAMIYLGDNWPATYRNSIFMNNIHGHRVNNDVLERKGAGYTGKHAPDFMISSDPWFRGISLKYGPDGGVYVSNWSDTGECHGKTGIHRTSGQIFKIVYGTPKVPPANFDIAKHTDAELVALQLSRNDWFVRQARLNLQQRAAEGIDLTAAHKLLHDMFASNPDVTRKLRALWALQVSGGLDEKTLLEKLDHEDEHIRGWAIRFLAEDRKPSEATVKKWALLAAKDNSPMVRLFLAAALQRMPVEHRIEIAMGLAGWAQDADDAQIPLMIWYGIEPLVGSDSKAGARLLAGTKIPLLRQYIARRIASKK